MRRSRVRMLCGIVAASVAACSSPPPLVTRPESPPAQVWIEDVDVFDVVGGRVMASRDVLVTDGRIATVAATGTADAPAEARRIDGRGKTLLPGLIDMHTHIGSPLASPGETALPDPERNLQSFLYCGVTTVFEAAGLSSTAFELRDAVAAGEVLGPRIFTAGPMVTAPGGHPVAIFENRMPWWLRWYVIPRLAIQVGDAAAGREAARRLHDLGADAIKLAVDRIPDDVPRIRGDVLAAVVEEGASLGLRSVAHIGSTMDAMEAAAAGVSAWMHTVYKDELDADNVERLARYGIPMVPTLVVFNSAVDGSEGWTATEGWAPTALERQTIPQDLLDDFAESSAGSAPEIIEKFRASLGRMQPSWARNVAALYEAGVTILAGSDNQSRVFAGPGLHRELGYLAEAGLPPVEILRAATLYPARFLEETDDPSFGVIAAGKHADLVLVDGDPIADLANLERIVMVMKDGVVIDRHPLD